MEVRDKLYIGGAWVPSTGKDVIEVVNSATEEVMGTIPAGHTRGRGPRRTAAPPMPSRNGRRRREKSGPRSSSGSRRR